MNKDAGLSHTSFSPFGCDLVRWGSMSRETVGLTRAKKNVPQPQRDLTPFQIAPVTPLTSCNVVNDIKLNHMQTHKWMSECRYLTSEAILAFLADFFSSEVSFFLFLPITLSCKNGVMTPMNEVVMRCSNVQMYCHANKTCTSSSG